MLVGTGACIFNVAASTESGRDDECRHSDIHRDGTDKEQRDEGCKLQMQVTTTASAVN
jgi:hypothetical protein